MAWPIWELPARQVGPIVCTELTAMVLVGCALWAQPVMTHPELVAAAIIVGLGLVHTEVSRPIERLRWRLMSGDVHVNLSSVWMFAGAILLPSGYAAVLAALVHTYMWLRSARGRAELFRQVFSTTAQVLSCLAAATAIRGLQQLAAPWGASAAVALAVTVGALVFLTLNTTLIAGAIAAGSAGSVGMSAADVLGGWDDNMLEVATLALGSGVALVLPINVYLVGFVVPPLLVLQRSALVRHLEEAASLDAKTGLLNSPAWHNRARAQLGRSGSAERQAVLVLDLDLFKDVNDRHGHLAGDQVLLAVASVLRREVRAEDIVGRFGGEEFVVLVTATSHDELVLVAERLRERVERLAVEVGTADGPLTIRGVTISVGVAVREDGQADLTRLLETADLALYEAKRAGRNRVQVGLPRRVEQERPHGAPVRHAGQGAPHEAGRRGDGGQAGGVEPG